MLVDLSQYPAWHIPVVQRVRAGFPLQQASRRIHRGSDEARERNCVLRLRLCWKESTLRICELAPLIRTSLLLGSVKWRDTPLQRASSLPATPTSPDIRKWCLFPINALPAQSLTRTPYLERCGSARGLAVKLWFLARRIWDASPGTLHLGRFTWDASSGTPHLGRSIWDALSGTLHLGRFNEVRFDTG